MPRALFTLLFVSLALGCGLTTPAQSDGACQEGFARDDEGRCSASSGGGTAGNGSMEDLDDDAPPDNECGDSEDCTLEMCPPDSVLCVCLPEEGICVPGCETDDDCPSIDGDPLLCDDDGICGPEEI